MKNRTLEQYGIRIGEMERSARNQITDVPGVRVGHATIDEANSRTGVTVVMPCEDNPFAQKLTAASFVLNGFGKTAGLMQIDELGTLETPIALTNTLNVGLVHDAMVSYMIERCAMDGIHLTSVNPLVCECNDSTLSDIQRRAVSEGHVRRAIAQAAEDFEEGDVGAGKGTVCHGLKGGIGSASRIVPVDGRRYTLGVLVQSNYGRLADLTICGRRFGAEIASEAARAECDRGSIIMILGTDLPVCHRQLQRIIKRMSVGLARLGSYIGHGSGEVMVGFTTQNRMPMAGEAVLEHRVLREDCLGSAFRAAAEACEEAVLSSMLCAQRVVGWDGAVKESLAPYLDALWRSPGV